jgi:osmotically inducible lipoprotein OsmB
MKAKTLGTSLVVLAMLSGCSNMSSTEQRTLSGAAIGAGAGAVIGAATGGNAATGAAIGAVAGGVGGYIYDKSKSSN